MDYNSIISEVSKNLNIPIEVVDTAYKSFYLFIKDKISELPLKENLTEEEFLKLRTNFNIPALGKLYCTYDKYKGMLERFKYIKKIKEEYENKKDNSYVHKDCDNNG